MSHLLFRATCAGALLAVASACAPALTSAGRVEMRAAGGPFQVLVPAMEVRGGVSPSLGASVAGRLRRMLAGLATHQAVPMDAVEMAKDRFSLAYLDSITAPQLAMAIGAQLSGWGVIEPGARGLRADVWFIDLRNGDRIELQGLTATGPGELANAIFAGFRQQAEGLFQAAVCSDELARQEYERALETCESAVDAAPRSGTAHYGKATALMHLERYEEALDSYAGLLRFDRSRRDALLNAGLTASHLQRGEEALSYYQRYLDLRPDDPKVGRVISGEIARTGDHVSALRVLEPFLDLPENRDDPDFQRYLFSLSLAAAEAAREGSGAEAARPFLEMALQAHERLGDGAAGEGRTVLRQLVAANNLLGNREEALRLAALAAERHAEAPDVWVQYAAVLSDASRHGEAAEALTRAVELDPAFEGLFLRRAIAYLESGRRAEAFADLDRAAAEGDGESVAAILYREGVGALREQRFADAGPLLERAHTLAGEDRKDEIAFYWGFALYKEGEGLARGNAAASPERARAALALLEKALPLVQESTNPSAAQVAEAARLYIANQQAIIRARQP